jgi:hypothetical protein
VEDAAERRDVAVVASVGDAHVALTDGLAAGRIDGPPAAQPRFDPRATLSGVTTNVYDSGRRVTSQTDALSGFVSSDRPAVRIRGAQRRRRRARTRCISADRRSCVSTLKGAFGRVPRP